MQRPLKPNERVRVYRNLHKKCLSVQDSNGIVIGHVQTIVLKNVKFVVRPAGRRKVLETKRKNVHAFAVGEVVSFQDHTAVMQYNNPVRYNPYVADTFLVRPKGAIREYPIYESNLVQINASGAIWAV